MHELSVEVASYPSSSCHLLRLCASDPWTAATAAFNALRLLAADVQALDSSSCSLVEKLVKAAAKRRSSTDRGGLTPVPQPQTLRQQQQQQTVDSEDWTPQEPQQGSQQTLQQQEGEERLKQQQQQLEKELLRLWSEAESQQTNAKEGTGGCISLPGSGEREEREACTAEDKESASSILKEVGQAQRIRGAADAAGEAETKTAQAGEGLRSSVSTCACAAPAICSDREAAHAPAFVGGTGEAGGRQHAVPAAAAAVAQADPCASAAAAAILDIERLLGALQQLLNRLYNIALQAQQILDILRWHVGPALVEQHAVAAAAAVPLPVAAAGTPAAAVSATSSETGRAAGVAGGAALAAGEVSACGSAARTAKQDKHKDDDQVNCEKRAHAEEEKETNQEGDVDAGEDEDGEHVTHPRISWEHIEEAEREVLEFPSTRYVGARPASTKKKALEQSHQQLHKEPQQQPPDYLEGHRPSQERQQVCTEKQKQERQREEQSRSRKQQQQQQVRQSEQQQNELAAAAEDIDASQRQQQRLHEKKAEAEQRNHRLVTLLQLGEAVVKTIEGDWRFKQEVKEEIHFDAPVSVFLAAKAAWSAKPYVSDLAPLLRKAASLTDGYNSSKHQQ